MTEIEILILLILLLGVKGLVESLFYLAEQPCERRSTTNHKKNSRRFHTFYMETHPNAFLQEGDAEYEQSKALLDAQLDMAEAARALATGRMRSILPNIYKFVRSLARYRRRYFNDDVKPIKPCASCREPTP